MLHDWLSFYLHMFYFPAFPICLHTHFTKSILCVEAGKGQWQGKNHLWLARPAFGHASHHIQTQGEAQHGMARQSRHNNKQLLLRSRQAGRELVGMSMLWSVYTDCIWIFYGKFVCRNDSCIRCSHVNISYSKSGAPESYLTTKTNAEHKMPQLQFSTGDLSVASSVDNIKCSLVRCLQAGDL